MWTSASWFEPRCHSHVDSLFHLAIRHILREQTSLLTSLSSLLIWVFLLISCSESIFIVSFHLVSICSSIPQQCKCLGILVLPNCANYLFTCRLPPWTVSCSSGHRSGFPLSPQCLAHSLELIGLLNKLEDYSNRMNYSTHFCRGTLQILESV